MNPIVSLRSLPEPAYILLGDLLPREGEGALRVLRSASSVLMFAPESLAILEFFSRLRGQSEAMEFAAAHGGSRDALAALVAAGTLVRLPESDELGVRRTLGSLCVRITASAQVARDGETVLLRVDESSTVSLGPISATVFSYVVAQGLESSIDSVTQRWGLDKNHVWRSVIHDLTGVLMTGAGHLSEVSER